MDLPLHPKLVHLPLGLAVAMPFVTAALWLAWQRGWVGRRAWWLAVLLGAMQALGGLAAAQAGHADEEIVERVVDEAAIEEHEEAGTVFTWAGVGLFVVMLLTGADRNERRARLLAGLCVLGSLGVLGLGVLAGEAGGRLVYEQDAAKAHRLPPPPPGADHDDEEHEH